MQTDKMEELLMELSTKISAMQKDIDSIKSEMHSNYIRSDENDNAVRELVEERTKGLRLELQGQIDIMKRELEFQAKAHELYDTKMKTLSAEIDALRDEKKNKVFSRWESITDRLFWVIVAVVIAAVFKYLNFTPPKPF